MKKHEHFVLLGLPKSSSTWFGKIVRDTAGMSYAHEFFSLYQNADFAHSFGHEGKPALLAIHSHRCKDIMKAWDAFRGSGHRITKEVFSAFKLPFFSKHAQCVCIYRSRQLTFPGNSPDTLGWIGAYYQSAVEHRDIQSSDIKSILDAVDEIGITPRVRALAGWTIAYHQLLSDARKRAWKPEIPVLEIEKVCTLPAEELEEYLETTLPEELYSKALFEAVLSGRLPMGWITERRQSYKNSELEDKYQRLIANVKNLPQVMR